MLILTIRTDKPDSEIGLYDDSQQLAYVTWPAHRQLAETIHIKIQQLLQDNSVKLTDLQGICCFKGPGSFTGLRIGLTTGNAVAYALQIPIVAMANRTATSEDWIDQAIVKLIAGETDTIAMPEYGADVHITTPKS